MTGDPNRDQHQPECPGPELLAARIEGRLSGRETARVDEHLAGCPLCYEALAETIRFSQSEAGAEERPVGVTPGPRRFPSIVRVLGLAAAAALLVALPLSLTWTPSAGVEPLVAELADALGPRRLVEPRLSGDFAYARLETLRAADAPAGLDAQPPEVLAAVARIRERARDEPSPDALGALALTYLVSGDASAAVDALEDATAQSPDDPRLLSDLAAAYLARASQLDEPADVPQGLEAAERAVALPGVPDAAWFNRALALERLPLTDEARAAWRDYLARDATSGWADEARQHLADLEDRRSSAAPDAFAVRAALERGDAALEALARKAPERLRTHLEDVLLPDWAEAYLDGRDDAHRLRERALALGDVLTRATGDLLPRDEARALLESEVRGSTSVGRREQALGYRALRHAEQLYDLQRPSCDAFRVAQRHLAAGGSPSVVRASLQAVVNCVSLDDAEPALTELSQLESLAAARGYTWLTGRTAWLQGVIHLRRGELTTSLAFYRSALTAFHAIRDATGEATMRAALAENRLLLGEARGAWSERVRALTLVASLDSPRRQHAILSEALLAALDAGTVRAASHFGTTLVKAATGWANPMAVSAALSRQAEILDSLGAETAAVSDIEAAREWVARIADPASAERMQAELDVTEGAILTARRPDAAIHPLERALAYCRVASPFRVPALHLALSRANAARGNHAEAETHLLAGIEAMENERIPLRDAAAQLSFFEQALPLFDDVVRLQVARGDPERALAFVERGHARQLTDALAGAATPPLAPEALRRKMPDGAALVYYLPLEDRLYAWTLTGERIQFIERPLPAAELSRLVAAHRTAIERRASPDVVHRTAARLHDALVQPLIPFIAAQRALVFIADGVLQRVPFAALWSPETGRYLVEDYVLGVAPSGTVFVRASAGATALRNPRALVVGNPNVDRAVWIGLGDLPGAEAEANDVARLYPRSETLTGAAATRRAFLGAAGRNEIVHFAGHALAHSGDPSSARLILSPDPALGDSGGLALRDLEGAALARARLVVLAACRTAGGPVSRVEGALSLGRPFLAAGVPDVVGSLWDVDDTLSRRFFVAFHRALLEVGRPERALRAAQLELLEGGDALLGHPASWAPFICIGGFGPQSPSSSFS